MIIAALKSCGYPCSSQNMGKALASTHIQLPGLITDYQYTSSQHYGPDQFVFMHWDSSAKLGKVVATLPAGTP
jgi:hypothetical protein